MGQLTAILKRKDGTVVEYDLVPRKVLEIGTPTHQKIVAKLSAEKFCAKTGKWEDRGILSTRVVTTAFVNLLVDALQGISGATINTFNRHDSGTGTNVESVVDIALQTPCGEAADIGSQIEGASANIYKSVAEHTYTTSGGFTITEHVIKNADDIVMDRSVFADAGIPVDVDDVIRWTYQLSVVAGG